MWIHQFLRLLITKINCIIVYTFNLDRNYKPVKSKMAYRNMTASQTKWSSLPQNAENLEMLPSLTFTEQSLRGQGYVFNPLSEEEIWTKMRCSTCGQRIKKWDPYTAQAQGPDDTGKHPCLFHDGQFFRVWQCCSGHLFSQGCWSQPIHDPVSLIDARHQWQLYRTPIAKSVTTERTKLQGFVFSSSQSNGDARRGRRYVNNHTIHPPSSSASKDIRTAVALDCEMGTPANGTCYDNVLIRLSVVDFFTGESLINQLVVPEVDMLHYNTRFSGVTYADMRIAKRDGTAITGTDAARELLHRFVDSNTFIVMHSGNNDLAALRLIHPADRIIDTYILEVDDHNKKEALATVVNVQTGEELNTKSKQLPRNLKDVCLRRCGIQIQNAKLSNGRNAGHDSLEDAMATREVAISWIKELIPAKPIGEGFVGHDEVIFNF